MSNTNWKNFSAKELMCRCGKCTEDSWKNMDEEFMDDIQILREQYGKPMTINSAYRCANHPAETDKKKPGQHNKGNALDIGVSGSEAYGLLELAFKNNFAGIGVHQKGQLTRFIHLDGRTKPMIWSY